MDDTENLKTGIKHDKYIVGIPKSWVKSGNNFLNFLTQLFHVTTSANPSTRGFLPQDLFDLSPPDLAKKFGAELKGTAMKVLTNLLVHHSPS